MGRLKHRVSNLTVTESQSYISIHGRCRTFRFTQKEWERLLEMVEECQEKEDFDEDVCFSCGAPPRRNGRCEYCGRDHTTFGDAYEEQERLRMSFMARPSPLEREMNRRNREWLATLNARRVSNPTFWQEILTSGGKVNDES